MTALRGTAEQVAVLDAGVRVKGAATVEEFWSLLLRGADLVDDPPAGPRHPAAPAHPTDARRGRGAFLDDVTGFDADYFGLSPREAACMDPQHRLLLEVASEALMRSGTTRAALDGTRTGIYFGLLASDYLHLQLRGLGADPDDRHWLTGADPAFAAGRMAYLLGARGPAMTVNSACSSSLLAVHLASQALRLGECDLALAGGASLILAPDIDAFMTRIGALSPSGTCRPFAAGADGIVRSEGAAVLVLKRLADARADGDDVLAVLRGSAVNHDGRSAGLTVPSGRAQRRLYEEALRVSGVEPQDVGYLEAHGTGTPLGDPIELDSLSAVYGTAGNRRPWVGSVKANLGHLDAAAGVTGLLKAALVVRHGQVPAQLHAAEPTSVVRRSGFGLRLPQQREDWEGREGLRTAGVSAFGLSGTNVHVVVQQSEPAQLDVRATDGRGVCTGVTGDAPTLLLLSHRTPEGLTASASALGRVLERRGDELAQVAAATARSRDHYPERLALLVADAPAAVRALAAGSKGPGARSGRVGDERMSGPVLVFGGQGNEWNGMLADPGDDGLAGEAFARVVEACRSVATSLGGHRLAGLLADPGSDDVTDPALAPGATFTLQVAQVARWAALGVRPGAVMGHSLGEAAAAHTAGSIDLQDGLRIVLARTSLVDGAGPTGRMLAVGLDPAAAAEAVRGTRVEVACLNAGQSCTLAGPADEVTALADRLSGEGVFARLLGGRHAFHSQAMRAFADPLRAQLADLRHREPSVKRYSSVPRGADDDPIEEWVANMCQPVHFSSAVRRALDDGWTTFLEIGPTAALGRAVRDVAAEAGVSAVVTSSLRRGASAEALLLGAVADLYVAGEDLDLDAVLPGRRASNAAPTYAWQRSPHWHTPSPCPTPQTPVAARSTPTSLRVQVVDAAGTALVDLSTHLPAAPSTTREVDAATPGAQEHVIRPEPTERHPATPPRTTSLTPAVTAPADEVQEEPAGELVGEVRSAVRSVLGLADDAELDGRTDLRDLGLDSVGAADLSGRLQRRLRIDVADDVVLTAPSVDGLVGALGPGAR